jgi:hypothetical protein
MSSEAIILLETTYLMLISLSSGYSGKKIVVVLFDIMYWSKTETTITAMTGDFKLHDEGSRRQ